MAKVLLVEDDNNLREIYEARLQAEGYDIASARDGEEALVVAKQEQPDLIISDVMMPKISGFEMLDILRNTEGLQAVKVIMLTALGQSEDQSRADSLGADRYLVKSQVTLEDIVNAAHDLLVEAGAIDAPAATAPEPQAAPIAVPTPAPVAAPPFLAPAADPTPVATPPVETATAVIPLATAPPEFPEAQPDIQMPVTADEPATPPAVVPEPVAPAPIVVDDDTQQTSDQENATVQSQINDFVQSESGQPEPQVEPQPESEPITEPLPTPAPDLVPVVDPAPALDPALTAPEPTVVNAPQPTAPTAREQNQDNVLNDALEQLGGTDIATESAPAVTEHTHKKVIEPLSPTGNNDVSPEQRLQDLLAAEAAKEAAVFGSAPQPSSVVNPDTPPAALPPEFQPTPQPPLPQPVQQAAPSAPPIQTEPMQQPPTPAPASAPAAPQPVSAPAQPATVPKPPVSNGDFDPNSIAL